MLVSLSLLGVVAARMRSQHQLVIGQKISSEVAVSATGTAEVQADTMMKIDVGDTGRFKKVGSDQWLHCPDIIRRCALLKIIALSPLMRPLTNTHIQNRTGTIVTWRTSLVVMEMNKPTAGSNQTPKWQTSGR